MSRRFSTVRAAGASWLLLALVAGVPAAAQEPTPEPTRVATPTAAPLPLGEVAVKSDELAVYLRQVEERTTTNSPEQPIATALPDVARQAREQADVTRRLLDGSPTLREVDTAIEIWNALQAQLDGWRTLLTARVGELEAELGGLTRLRAIWRATRDEARAEQAPPAVVERITATINAIATTRDIVDAQRQRLLVLQDAVVAQSATIREPRQALIAYRERGLDSLLVADAPPLWKSLRAADGGAALGTAVANATEELRTLRVYLGARLSRLGLLAAACAVLAFALYRARLAAGRWSSEDAALARAARAFELPISSAILVVLVAARWVLPDMPLLLRNGIGLFVLVPTLRLLRRLVDRPLAPALWALGAFYVVDLGCRFLSGAPALEQGLFLFEMLAAAALLGWLLRSGRFRALFSAESRWADAALRAARLLIALLVLAGVAGACGFMQLARYLQEVLIDSSFAAVVLFGLLQVLEGVWAYVLRSRLARRLRMVEDHRPLLQRRGERVLGWLAFGVWLLVLLNRARLLRPGWPLVRDALGATVQVGSLTLSLGAVLAFVVTIWLSFLLSRFLRFVLEEDVYPRLELRRGMPYALSRLTHYAVLLIGFFIALAAMGIDLDRFALLAGAFSVGIGFGLQTVVNNFVSGLILLFERPIKVGDVIQLAQITGEVKRIGIRSSLLRTGDGSDVIVPNGQLVSSTVTNLTPVDARRRIEIPVNAAYGTDPEQVLTVLRRIAGSHAFVLEHPAPSAIFNGFGETALNFTLVCWTDRLDRAGATRSDLAVAISAAFRDAGIEIPHPAREMRVTGGDAPLAVTIKKEG